MTTGADWLDSARRLVDALRPEPSDDPTTGPAAEGGHGADCRWCPVCQVAAVVRGERPEITAALADVLTTTAAALRTFAGEPTAPDPDEPSGGDRGDRGDRGDEPPGVQRIEVA